MSTLATSSTPTLESVTTTIIKLAKKFEADYGIQPFDVVLGSTEFHLLEQQSNLPDDDPSSKWRLEAARYFFQGMRVRLAASDGIMVGCLTAKE